MDFVKSQYFCISITIYKSKFSNKIVIFNFYYLVNVGHNNFIIIELIRYKQGLNKTKYAFY